MRLLAPDVLQIHAHGVCIYALRRGDELVLIDSGFLGASAALGRALKMVGWDRCRIRGIILTHGHLDHTFNAFRFAREFGAWVAAPELDKPHVAGEYQYSGAAKVCGWLESAGRRVFGYQVPPEDEVDWFAPGHVFHDWLGGMEVIALPGHTIGHCGLYCAERRWLFSGDLFASFWWSTHLPPAILNSLPEKIPTSVRAALDLEIDGVLPAHCDRAVAQVHLRRLRRMAQG
ncbi:MAG: glyoxylase-like metal-dependent hydrolase (beta-lactamase superfamily II) [Pseudoalteromonas tetraodonis]|jgi:glyoxylase-like metal-dependent hydrolase (beta-lactamase superfamily II)